MSIEFRCTGCNKLLRTGEGTAGKQAKCPECGAVVTIPAAGAVPADEAPPPAPPPPPWGAEAGSPFVPAGPKPAAFDPENPYAAPREYTASAPGYAPPGAFTPTIIDFGDVFSRTWTIFKVQWGMCLGVVLLGWLIATVGFLVLFYGPLIVGVVAEDEVLIVVGLVVGYLLGLAFMTWIMIGTFRALLRIARGEQASIGELFGGGGQVIRVFLMSLLLMLMSYGILLACALPGLALMAVAEELGLVLIVAGILVGYVFVFILMLMFSQAFLLIVDRNVGVIDSLKISKQITRGNRLTLFLLWLVAMALYLVSWIPCGLGIFVSIPFLALMLAVVYLAMTGQRTADQMLPAQPLAR